MVSARLHDLGVLWKRLFQLFEVCNRVSSLACRPCASIATLAPNCNMLCVGSDSRGTLYFFTDKLVFCDT